MTKYDGKLEQARMAIAEAWTRTIMRPILASGMIDQFVKLAGLDDGHDTEWLLDALASERQCEKCEGDGKIDCTADGCDRGYIGDEYCPRCADGRVDCPIEECEDGQIQLGEILEFWIVEERAERRLREAGETMIDADDIGLGSAIWCRRTSGQGIAGDGVIMNCAEAFAIDCPWMLENVNAEHVAYWTANREGSKS